LPISGKLQILSKSLLLKNEMKTCTYCKEEINKEATKCRYCGSVVGDDKLETNNQSRYVTYVLDQDLVRFVKVAGAFLAVFLLVGAFLYGFDLKQAAKEIRDAQKEAVEANRKMKETEQAVLKMKEQVKLLVEDAKVQIAQIHESSKTAELIVISLQQQHSGISQTTIVQAIQVERNISVSRKDDTKLWVNGAKLRISFLGGDKDLQEKVIRAANQWLETANLQFDFGSWEESEIRISFEKNQGAWSYVGADALNIPQDSATMNFGWLTQNSSEEEIALTVLPQFGHALGLYNEHQNPSAEIPWDVENIKKELSGSPNFWNEEQIDRQFFQKWPSNAFPIKKDFDSESVMFQKVNQKWLNIELTDRKKTTLSHGDKVFVGKLYPTL
jgi:hypothetical protein